MAAIEEQIRQVGANAGPPGFDANDIRAQVERRRRRRRRSLAVGLCVPVLIVVLAVVVRHDGGDADSQRVVTEPPSTVPALLTGAPWVTDNWPIYEQDPAAIWFDPDGTFRLRVSCFAVDGTYAIAEGAVTVSGGSPAATPTADDVLGEGTCEASELDQHILDLVRAGDATLFPDRLTLGDETGDDPFQQLTRIDTHSRPATTQSVTGRWGPFHGVPGLDLVEHGAVVEFRADGTFVYSCTTGPWSISAGRLSVDTVPGGLCDLLIDPNDSFDGARAYIMDGRSDLFLETDDDVLGLQRNWNPENPDGVTVVGPDGPLPDGPLPGDE